MNRPRAWNDERDAEACALMQAGHSIPTIARMWRVSEATLRKRCGDFRRDNGLDRAGLWTPEMDTVLLSGDYTLQQKIEMLGRSKGSIDGRKRLLRSKNKPTSPAPVVAAEPAVEPEDPNRPPLPRGHPVSWNAIALTGELWR